MRQIPEVIDFPESPCFFSYVKCHKASPLVTRVLWYCRIIVLSLASGEPFQERQDSSHTITHGITRSPSCRFPPVLKRIGHERQREK